MLRTLRAREIGRRLGRRKLIWFGTRGSDCAPLLEFPQFQESYALTAPLGSAKLAIDLTLEAITDRRVDLDAYDIDADKSQSLAYLRDALLSSIKAHPAAILPYRPSVLLSSVYLPNADDLAYLGVLRECHTPFDHKAWVETELRKLGVCTIPWTYLPDTDLAALCEKLADGPLVVRRNHTSGGAGVMLLRNARDVFEKWPHAELDYLAIAPYFDDAVPVNVAACVYPGGGVTLHPPSVQLIGLTSCTDRAFGYCGNDFGAIRHVSADALDSLEATVLAVGRWLCSRGFVGAYGVDALVRNNQVLFAELNPRFQGSSRLSAEMSQALGLPDVLMDQIAAFVSLEPWKSPRLRDYSRQQPEMSQVIVHNRTGSAGHLVAVPQEVGAACPELRCDLVPAAVVAIEPGAAWLRLVLPYQVTTGGFTVDSLTEHLISLVLSRASAEYAPVKARLAQPAISDDGAAARGSPPRSEDKEGESRASQTRLPVLQTSSVDMRPEPAG